MPHRRTPYLRVELSAPSHPLLLGVPGGNIHFWKRMDVQSWLEWTSLIQLAQVVPRGGQSLGLSWKCMTTCFMYVRNLQRLHGVDSWQLVTEVLYPGTSSSPYHTQTWLWKPRSQQLHLGAFSLVWLCWSWYRQGSHRLLSVFFLHNQKGLHRFGIASNWVSTCYQIAPHCRKPLTCLSCCWIVSKPDLACWLFNSISIYSTAYK